MDIFLDRILKILPILGTSLFSIPSKSEKSTEEKLICKIKGLMAFGNRTENGFLVYKDSKAVLEDRESAKRNRIRRQLLIDKGVLVQKDKHYLFTKDHEFTSPSLAASVICGGATNGLTKWKTKEGKSLKEIEGAEQL